MNQFKVHKELPLSIIETVYEQQEVLKLAWPEANYPIDHNQWRSWFKNDDKTQSHGFSFSGAKGDVAFASIKTYKEKPGLSYLCLVAVKKDEQGKGIGRDFIKEILNHCQESLGILNLYLLVYRNNLIAKGLYESLGFQYVDGENPMRFKINLSKP